MAVKNLFSLVSRTASRLGTNAAGLERKEPTPAMSSMPALSLLDPRNLFGPDTGSHGTTVTPPAGRPFVLGVVAVRPLVALPQADAIRTGPATSWQVRPQSAPGYRPAFCLGSKRQSLSFAESIIPVL